MLKWIILAVVILALVALVLANIRVVPQSKAFVLERLGTFYANWQTGLHVKIPFIDRIAKTVSLKEQVVDFKPQAVITKDNVTMQIDTVVFFQITDPKLFAYGVENPIMAIENLSATTLRNIIGEMELDSTLTSRDTINTKIRVILDEATDPWGIKVNRVELKNIIPPREIQDAMEKQMKAEREKREKILQAEAFQESEIKKADGEAKAMVKRAEAKRDADIAIAQGKAKAIEMTYEAEAKGLEKLKDAQANSTVVQLKSFEALQKLADGKATKIIVPTSVAESTTKQSIFAEMLKTPIEEDVK